MKTIKDIAQDMYPVEEKAECYTAFLEGAEQGHRQAIQFVTDLLLSTFERGKLSKPRLAKVFNALKEEIG